MGTKHASTAAAPQAIGLADLPSGVRARVVAVAPITPTVPFGLSKRLADLGFLPGEQVRIVARGWLAREPLAIRVGTATFALRRFEAACVKVCPDPSVCT